MPFALAASVIIPCYRADSTLPLQLEALSNQVEAPPFEVLLADNGANDSLQKLVDDFSGALPHLRVVDATQRSGAGYARNVGMAAAKTERLLLCDADDVVMPEWVAWGVRQLDRHPVFSGGAVPITEALCDQGWRAVVEAVGPHAEIVSELPLSGTEGYPILMGGSFGIRRDLARKLGGFDLAFGSSAEDNDLAFRIVRSGISLPDAGHVCIAYRIRDESATFAQGFRAGVAHARLCARHSAWNESPSFRGRWALRPARSVVRALRGKLWQSADSGWKDQIGRELGLLAGWLRFRAGLGLPKPELWGGWPKEGSNDN